MNVQAIRDLVARLEAGLRTRSENGKGFYAEYSDDRSALLAFPEVRTYIPQFIINSPDAEIAFGYMRNHAIGTGSWSARREYVSNNFTELRKYLDSVEANAMLLGHAEIREISLNAVSAQLSRAKLLIASDLASALTKAETALASVCKHILLSEGHTLGKADSLPSLVSRVTRDVLELEAELDVRNFSGVSNQAQLIAEIRNRYGDAHPAPDPDDYLAEYALTTAGALAIFLLKRYERQNVGLA